MNSRGLVLWQGISLLDGSPIALLATKGKPNSVNQKTGSLIQIGG